MEAIYQAQSRFRLDRGLRKIRVERNTNYKRHGTKSYVYLLSRFGFEPTKPGPYFQARQIKQRGLAHPRFHAAVGGRAYETKILQKKLDADGTQTGEVTAEDQQFDSMYLCEVSIGVPPQKFKLDFDTGSADLWVFSKELNKSIQKGHNVFHPSSSLSFKKLAHKTWKISYGDGSSASGDCGSDNVSIGGLTIENQTVELASELSQQFARSTGDGLLGLAFPTINTVMTKGHSDPANTPVVNMMAQGDIPKDSQLFTSAFYSQRDDNSPESFYTFGYIDTDLVSSSGEDITWTDIDSSQGFWMFPSASASVNGKIIKLSGNKAIADTGTTLVLVSDEVCEALYDAIPGATYDSTKQGYVFPKSTNVEDLPEFKVAIGDKQFVIQPEDLAFAPADNNNWYGGVQSRGNMSFDILGDTFLKSVYAIWDQGNQRFGLVPKIETQIWDQGNQRFELVPKKQDKDDSNQYERFSIHLEEPTQPEMSFPVSKESRESGAFQEDLPKILSYLRKKNIKWQSIECVGRIHDSEGGDKKIRSTVVIGISKLTQDTQTLQQDLQSVMISPALPVEFVEGGFVRLSHFGFKKLQRPLVCGASCGTVEREATGTIGGFVTISGDPDPDAVYAVTNHHVLLRQRDPIPWVNKDNLAAHLGIRDAAQDDLKALCGANVMDLGRNEIIKILELLAMIPSPSKPNDTGSYIYELVSQYFQRRQERQEGNKDQNGIESLVTKRVKYLKCLERLKPNKRLKLLESLKRLKPNEGSTVSEVLERLERPEGIEPGELLKLSDDLEPNECLELLRLLEPSKLTKSPTVASTVLSRWCEHNKFWDPYYSLLTAEVAHESSELASALTMLIHVIQSSCESAQNTLLEVLRHRRLRRNLRGLKNLVEHPSRVDRKRVIKQLGDEKWESQSCAKYWTSSGEVTHTETLSDDPAKEDHLRDITILEGDLNHTCTHDQNTKADRLIGIVWASSGKSRQLEPKYPTADRVNMNEEDWALVKLFPDIHDRLKNSFSSNILRPKQPEQSFIRVKPWMGLSTFRVSKRGRTTDYTIGEVNGSIGVGVLDRDESHEFGYSIVSTSANGLFALAGDSGSWIMDKGGQLVGMVWGQNTATKSALFTPAQYLFTWIQMAFERAMEKKTGSLQGTFKKGERVNIFQCPTLPKGI